MKRGFAVKELPFPPPPCDELLLEDGSLVSILFLDRNINVTCDEQRSTAHKLLLDAGLGHHQFCCFKLKY